MKIKLLLLLLFFSSFYATSQSFNKVNFNDLKGGYNGFASFVDYNGDGLLDVFVTGVDFGPGGDFRHAMFYKNNGDKTFTESSISNIPRAIYGGCTWGDYDKNGTQDLIYTGTTSGYAEDNITRIYKNVNNGCEFVEIPTSLPRLRDCTIEWVDVDNDGLLDIYYQGIDSNDKFAIGIFKNFGNDIFTKVENLGFHAINGGRGNFITNSSKWVDFDGDGLKDVIVASSTDSERKFEVYKNMGDFKFTPINLALPQLSYVKLDVADINNDGKPDFVFTGSNRLMLMSGDGDGLLYFYINKGNMNFERSMTMNNPGVFLSEIFLKDLNNDGFPDLINFGSGLSYRETKLYLNDKNGRFNEISHSLPICYSGGIDFGDFDNDNDLDILYYGRIQNPNDDEITYVYENSLLEKIYPDKIVLDNSCNCDFNASFSLNNAVDNVRWNFNDIDSGISNESSAPRPKHTFSKKGIYTVTATYTKNTRTETLTVNVPVIGPPVVLKPGDITVCDKTAEYNLPALKDTEILNGLPSSDYEITYYLSRLDAEKKQNKISGSYKPVNNQQSIFVRVQSTEKSICYTITDFNIVIKEAPVPNQIEDIYICDTDNDGYSIFDLSAVEGLVLANQTAVKVEYYDSNKNSIVTPLPANYRNITPKTDFITAKISNLANDCFVEAKINLISSALPIANSLDALIGCDDNQDGISEYFDTSAIERNVLKGQTDMTVTYFDESNQQLTSPLPNPFTNTIVNRQLITVVVTNNKTRCSAKTTLELKTSSKPTITKPQDLYACDEENGFAFFNTSLIESQLIGNQTGLVVTYTDNLGNTFPSPLPLNLKNTIANSQIIYVKVQNSLNPLCFSETNFSLIVNELPVINLQEKYALCDLEPDLPITIDAGFDTYEWKFEDGNVLSTTKDARLSKAGKYSINVTKNTNGIICSNTFNLILVRSKLPKIEKIVYDEFTSTNIKIIPSGDGVFEYSIDGINYQDSAVFTNLQGGTYQIYLRDKNKCGEDTKEIILLDYPKFVTPNNDGFNDYWHIKGIEKYPKATVSIYDRFGRLLKQLAVKDAGWDGKYNQRDVASDDYWFIVDLDAQGKTFKGHFSLKR